MQAQWRDPPPPTGGGGGVQLAMPSVTPVVKLLLIANAVMWAVVFFAGYFSDEVVWSVIADLLGLSPDVWRSWFPFFAPVWQLVTYGFLHSPIGLWHILGNMLFLYFLGTMLEEMVGSKRFAVVYFMGIVVAGLCQLAVSLLVGESTPVVGASGAVLAIVVATATLRPQQRIIFILFPITLKTLAFIYVGMDVYRLLMELKGMSSNVATIAHLAGAAYGFLAVKRGWIWKDPLAGWQRWRERAEEEREQADHERLDDLLAKINREGIHSLSSREKAFLKRASKRR